MNVLSSIRSRSREAWVRVWLEAWTNLRIWIQENGELAFVLAFVGGVFVCLAFKLVFVLALAAAGVLAAVWFYALPESKLAQPAESTAHSASLNGHSN